MRALLLPLLFGKGAGAPVVEFVLLLPGKLDVVGRSLAVDKAVWAQMPREAPLAPCGRGQWLTVLLQDLFELCVLDPPHEGSVANVPRIAV